MYEFLKEPLVGSIIGISGIIIGTFLAVFFYIKSKIIAKPKYTIENIILVDTNNGLIPKDVVMKYKDNTITLLNKTTVRFWNSGKKTIDKNDLVPKRLSIDFGKNCKGITHYIGYQVNKKSRDAIKVNLSISNTNNIDFNFNYLDNKDYFEIEILHTGEYAPARIIGDVKGVPNGIINVTAKAFELQDEFFNTLISSTSIVSDIVGESLFTKVISAFLHKNKR